MDKNDIKKVISTEGYDFLRSNKHLKDHILFVTISGSHAYGTNVEGSDIDLRGIALNSKQDLLGFGNFEHYVDESTDTTIFSVKKAFQLLVKGNPNMIEMFGNAPDRYLVFRPEAELILQNKDLFLSKAVASSFGGCITKLWGEIAGKYKTIKLDDEHSLSKSRKKVTNMIRLYYMAFDILEKGIVCTYRKDEHELLMNVRNGALPLFGENNGDGRVIIAPWLIELRNNLERKFQYDKAYTNLPDTFDMKKVQELLITINEMALNGW